LILCLLFSLLACSAGGNNTNGSDDDESTEGGSENGGENDGDENDGGNANKEKIDLARVTYTTSFREGKALVRYGEVSSDEYYDLHCIDKAGNILFTVEDVGGSGVSGFYGGYTTLLMEENGKSVVCLCNEKGEIIKPSDVGATSFLIDADSYYTQTLELLADGYIFAEKKTSDFSGVSAEAAILNADLEVIVDYSEQLREYYDAYISCAYYNGYLYGYSLETVVDVLDLRTGKLLADPSSFLEPVVCDRASDLWIHYDNNYVELVSGRVMVDLSTLGGDIMQTFDFHCGLAPVVFWNSEEYYFGLVKEDGSLCFEPVLLKGSTPNVSYDDGKFVLLSGQYEEYYVTVFDESGKCAEMTLGEEGFLTTAEISDGVVIVWEHGMARKITYYSAEDLTPLF
jgi:hypothetical protein